MPRKKAVADVIIKKNNKKNIIDSMIKENSNNDDDVILQLGISHTKINTIINTNNDIKIIEPTPYENTCYFNNDSENISCDNEFYQNNSLNKISSCCFWCCHSIDTYYGMPYNYDTINDTFYTIGSFCSLQCANAYNFSINSGSDKVWEINSWIQMIARRFGINCIIRPAPSRYLLKMFGGSLNIDEFREAHINNDKTYILNIPPMISVSSTNEILNTSYLTKKK